MGTSLLLIIIWKSGTYIPPGLLSCTSHPKYLKMSCLEHLNGQCFEDPRGSRVLPHGRMESSRMTIDKCKKFYSGRNYKYAGVEWREQCFCGNDRPPIPAPDTDCSMPCSGDKSEICGGGHRINVYQL